MLQLFKNKPLRLAILASITLGLVACNDDDDPETPLPPVAVDVTYQVTVTNLTNGQPLSPIAVILHSDDNLWMIGDSASVELETMAESGDNSSLLGLPMVLASASGDAPVGPGVSETFEVNIEDVTDAKLTVATMLVNTNDAFTGLNAWDLSQLAVGDTWKGAMAAYDAGTEGNSEAAGTIPGPADGGVGFEDARDDVDYVAMHPGVVTSADNLATSVLDSQHKFDNPVISISVTRIE
ncbi:MULTISPECIES: spondin domain-containing protein [Aliiglaciecola]|uniref:spondin domain-containing protein n=1 Tax=Aliiglaciecola TaxID=1406885 RepID=UPI001C09D2C4|nr:MULTISPECIES: spondin domain-containing protein [Aliiglaciecola]MBU2878808.1 spondin domain-containing protein [Aliiglaciecola lipolytica]MDO6711294.1 spondin domain-containing protein [Aliiglaciecola sp. 2_MG-2023]MDO6752257.1 spondin domain-containing protein [Aliiglaciecola sp. 1_MG-2023]